MGKTYFEMNDAEKQLTLIENNLDYATCVIAEGLQGDYNGMELKEVRELQNNICKSLIEASDCII